MNPPQRGNPRGRRWFPFNNRRNWTGNKRSRPISIPITIPDPENSQGSTLGFSSSSSNAPVVAFLDRNTEQYPGWKLYFPEETFSEGSNLCAKLKAFDEHLVTNPAQYDLQNIQKRLWYPLELMNVTKDDKLMLRWPTFEQDLYEHPEETLKCLGLSMHQRLIDHQKMSNVPLTTQTRTQDDSTPKKNFSLQRVHARIQTNLNPVCLSSVKVSKNGKLIVVRGNVVRVGPLEYRTTWIMYRCLRCNAEQAIKQINQTATTPTYCHCSNRSSSNFVTVLSSPFTMIEACQTIHLQEIAFGSHSGGVLRTIKIELFQDLVDCLYPGDDVTVTAIVECPPQDEHPRAGIAAMRTIHLKAVSISSNRNTSITWKSTFSHKDVDDIRAIRSTQDPFRLLVHSLSPMIYGHEMIKAGLILSLLGGSDNPFRRSQSHVLVVGDPGLGKSQMLQACSDASPKGIFVCGKTSSTAGLTVTIHHEKGNDTSLGAGPLLLADQGTCCIDELDKMSNSNEALLEVMEQQCVNIAKAGVFCSLPARTSIIAAANPTGGHYNKSRTVSENVKMNPALLSRFDLVFIIVDRPDAEQDSVLHDHRRAYRNMPLVLSSSHSFNGNQPMVSQEISEPLNVRLKRRTNETTSLSREQMQTYIAYARKNCNPKLSENASNLLKDFYLELRNSQEGCNSIPVTTRQLEAMIRLTQARARAELCDEATAEHAFDVITIVRHSMVDILSTNVGTLQMQRKVNGSGMSQPSQIKKFIQILQMSKKSIFSMDELKELADNGNLRFLCFSDAIETMNIQGFLLKKGQGLYKFLRD